jgi:predicted dienelactone hydrolase
MKKMAVVINLMFLGVFWISSASALYKLTTGPHSIDMINLITLQDNKRGKELQIRVTFPKNEGKYPVIIWSHGATGTKDMYQALVKHWVSHGYLCIQANHSDSRALGKKEKNETLRDWDSRPKDVTFILDSLDQIENEAEALKNKMNQNIIGVGGHSFGAQTA